MLLLELPCYPMAGSLSCVVRGICTTHVDVRPAPIHYLVPQATGAGSTLTPGLSPLEKQWAIVQA